MTVTEGDILRMVLEYTYPGAGVALNIFHWVYGGITRENIDILPDLGAWGAVNWGANWDGLAPDEAELQRMRTYRVSNLGVVLEEIGVFDLSIVGSNPGDVSAAAVAGYIQCYTETPRVFGKKYVPAIDDGLIVNGILTAGAINTLSLMATEMVTPFVLAGGGTIFGGVISKKTLDFELYDGSVLLEILPAYQRRRKEGVGS